MTDEKREALLRKCVRRLRADGYSYEEIPDHLEGPGAPRLEPWGIYAAANPGKSAAQVAAWRRKHFPGSGGEVARALGSGAAASRSKLLD